MKFARKLAVLALLSVTFVGAPVARAEQSETTAREPAAAKKKKKSKAKAGSHKAKGKTNKKSAKKATKKAARAASRAKSHSPAPGNSAVPDPYTDLSTEKKDDLPPPANTTPSDE